MVAAMERRTEPRAEALARHLQAAHERGLQLFMEHESEQWFCTSARMEGVVYRVSAEHCTCPGWAAWKRCSHQALFLERFGLRPPTAAELEHAIEEAARWEQKARTGQCKSTADWRMQLSARHRAERLLKLASGEPVDELPPAA